MRRQPRLSIEEQISWLEQMLEARPDKIEDVLRIAGSLPCIAETTSGNTYLEALRKKAAKPQNE